MTALCVPAVLAACNQSAPASGTASAGTEISAPQASGTVKIAYVNIDTVLTRYDLAVELRTSLEAKYKKAENELNSKMNRLQKDVLDYQEKIQKGLVTRSQAAEMEERLNMQQQTLIENRDKLMGELSEEEAVMNNRIYYGVTEFLTSYNADGKYSMILSTTAAGPVLNADPSLDITAEVVNGLNRRYAEEKKSAAK